MAVVFAFRELLWTWNSKVRIKDAWKRMSFRREFSMGHFAGAPAICRLARLGVPVKLVL